MGKVARPCAEGQTCTAPYSATVRAYGAFITLWSFFSMFLYLNRAVGERQARAEPLDDDGRDSGMMGTYALIYGMAFAVIFLVALWKGVPILTGVEVDAFTKHGKLVVRSYVAFVFISYIVLATVIVGDATDNWRGYELNRRALAATATPQLASCYDNYISAVSGTTPPGIGVHPNAVWVMLADTEWVVDRTRAIDVIDPNDNAWRYLTAPIVYEGAAFNIGNITCAFEPTLYAVCAYRASETPTDALCGWELPQGGGEGNDAQPFMVSLRRLKYSQWYEASEQLLFPLLNATAVREDVLWEFNAASYKEIRASVMAVDDARVGLKMRLMWLWLAGSLVTLLAFSYGVYNLPEHGYETAEAPSEYAGEDVEMSVRQMPAVDSSAEGGGDVARSRAGSRVGDDDNIDADLDRSRPLLYF